MLEQTTEFSVGNVVSIYDRGRVEFPEAYLGDATIKRAYFEGGLELYELEDFKYADDQAREYVHYTLTEADGRIVVLRTEIKEVL